MTSSCSPDFSTMMDRMMCRINPLYIQSLFGRIFYYNNRSKSQDSVTRRGSIWTPFPPRDSGVGPQLNPRRSRLPSSLSRSVPLHGEPGVGLWVEEMMKGNDEIHLPSASFHTAGPSACLTPSGEVLNSESEITNMGVRWRHGRTHSSYLVPY